MRAAKILYKNIEAGLSTQYNDGTFTFQYHATWVEVSMRPTISLFRHTDGDGNYFALHEGLLPANIAQGKIRHQFAILAEKAGIAGKIFDKIMEEIETAFKNISSTGLETEPTRISKN